MKLVPQIRQTPPDNFFELPDFLIVQDLEFFLPPSLRDRSAVLSDED
jgi:hypothetical protein